ncbi:MAG: DegT/DnrJ/EryC1/StrS family aminotransferase [Synergistales bacterium]|nr:DegT/DnrJ/EryC1/StrS family aminotransferase [Synergistales bacterium]MDY6401158.1 DegT/DnrJ/EryC1/StrS family aminotransferase [Synergistales bacterium]MDY6404751.1 DegT/DnrJ/EryC1/StrS family aminotransferase [Synergistales bacterium]MDY6409957.1 DegT/DnrJ/EryC1/StrS family aminotransferase [Synergistales bacterium]MDY6414509.1 DegT/DnrJ/EryC1/StrS family aminotransferase [Synergistales bacterium]
MTVPILDLRRSFKEIKPEVFASLERIFENQSFILGSDVSNFERHCEKYLELPEGSAVGCASGTDALLLALMAADIKEGDEVITTPFTFFATSGTVARLGAKPVFVDVDLKTYNINLEQAVSKINKNTKIFLPVHLFGQMCELEEVKEIFNGRGVKIIEDAAQAFGSSRIVDKKIERAGTVGDIGCYSFFPTKNLGGCGDGGMVVTKDLKTAERLKKLRVHGSGTTYYHEEVGINSRLDAIQAAILDIKLKYLEQWNEERIKIADYYKLLFKSSGLREFVTPPEVLDGNRHIYHQYVVRVHSDSNPNLRDELMNYLNENGCAVRVYYPLSLHLQPCFRYLGYKEGDFPVSEKLTREVLALPIFPGLEQKEQEEIVESMVKFFNR